MAHKLPVGEVLNEAFQFGMHRWMTVIRFLWLPFVLSITLIVVVVAFIFDFEAAAAADTMEGFDAFKEILRFPLSITGLLIFAAYVGMFVLISGGMASIFRLVALGEDRPGVFQLRLDGPAWRVFWAFVIMGLLGTFIQGASFLAAIAITGQSPAEFFNGMWAFFQLAAEAETGAEPSMEEMQPLLSAMGVFALTFLFALIPLIFLHVRLAPFPAGSAAENRLLFFGAFNLTT